MKQARIITSLNLKGGVGKTHLCWLVAGVCEERGLKCLVIDLDKQANISTSLIGDEERSPGSDKLFNPRVDVDVLSLIRSTSLRNVDVIPANFELDRFDSGIQEEWDVSGMGRSLWDPTRQLKPRYDYILVDCPANISLLTYAALCASDYLMVPLEAAEWGAIGPNSVLAAAHHISRNKNKSLEVLGLVVSRFKKARKYQKAYLRELRQHFATSAFDTVIPDNAMFEQSVNDRIPITIHSPSSHASEIARQFFDEIECRCERLECGGSARS